METNKLDKLVLELVEELSIPDIENIARECNSWDGSFENVVAYELNEYELRELLGHMDPLDILNQSYFGTYNPNHDYFRFDGYGNLETLTERDYYEELADYAEDIIYTALENGIIQEDGSF